MKIIINKFKVLVICCLMYSNTSAITEDEPPMGRDEPCPRSVPNIYQQFDELSSKHQKLLTDFEILKKQNLGLIIENAKLQQQIVRLECNRVLPEEDDFEPGGMN